MNILFDTNVLISAIITNGICYNLYEYCIKKKYKLFTSNYIKKEIKFKLLSKFNYNKKEINEIINELFKFFNFVEPTEIKIDSLKDKNDEPIIGTALSGKCNFLITGDKELLNLKKYKNIIILSPTDFLKKNI